MPPWTASFRASILPEFCALLDECRQKAALSTADLALWFGVPRTSVHNWLRGVQPHNFKQKALHERLMLLVKLLNKPTSPFPVPPGKSQFSRILYIRDVLHAATGK
jgi:hypothetical protein